MTIIVKLDLILFIERIFAIVCFSHAEEKSVGEYQKNSKMIDSPYYPYSNVRFTGNEKGIDDTEEKEPKTQKRKGG